MTPKFKVGDRVKIIRYGHNAWVTENNVFFEKDFMPEMVGKEGIIIEVSDSKKYVIDGVKGKHAWYNREQLELLK